jgi:hypothetical protein
MSAENKDCDKACLSGITRREFLRLAAIAGILTGCQVNPQSVTSPTSESSTSKPEPASVATYSSDDFSQMAFCGIRCRSACPENAYPNNCEGCKSASERLNPFCAICSIRKCARAKQVLTCAHCDEYLECKVDTWQMYPMLREKIDQIRVYLQAQP